MSSRDDAHCPDVGDLIWINFDPQAGREPAGRRPAFVLSPRTYNLKVDLCVLCPIINRVKGYPFEVAVHVGLQVAGVVLADQVKSLSWERRNASLADRAPLGVQADIRAKLKLLLGF